MQNESLSNVNDALYYSRLLCQQQREFQHIVHRHKRCLNRLREVAKEAEIRRQENASLRTVMKRISILIKPHVNAATFENIDGSSGGGDHREQQKLHVQGGMREEEELFELEEYNRGKFKPQLCIYWHGDLRWLDSMRTSSRNRQEMHNESLSSSSCGNLGAKTPVREPSININDALFYSRLLSQQRREFQVMVNRHSRGLKRLREVTKEIEILGQENASLRTVMKHISILIKPHVNNVHHLQANDFHNINVATFGNINGGDNGRNHQEQGWMREEELFELE